MSTTKQHGQPVPTTSADLTAERLAQLQQLFPEAFTEGRVDFDKLRAALGDQVDDRPERYIFSWAGKKDAIRLLQTPTSATLIPAEDESVNWDTTQNLFIEGDNLEVLKLLYKSYFGRVKMIYIDPPYNTGNDFIYPDDFRDPLAAYERMTGDRTEAGDLTTSNRDTGGRFHSAWLTMMYPRLFLARQLLRDDGVIFVSIDDHELHNLRILMNEVFGEESFKNCIIFGRGAKNVQAQFETVDSLTVGHEYVVMYAKSPETRFKKLYVQLEATRPGSWNNHWRGTDRPTMRYELFGIKPSSGQWRWGEERSLEAINNYKRMLDELGVKEQALDQEKIDKWYLENAENNEGKLDLLRLSNTGKPEHYVPSSDYKLGNDLWTDISTRGSSEMDVFFDDRVFDNPKPTGLIRRMLGFITEFNNDDIILDFFAGSCSTAQAVLAQNYEDHGNRRFIMVQIPELTGNKDYPTIADIGKERIRRVIAEIQSKDAGKFNLSPTQDLGFKVFRLTHSHLKPWTGTTQPTPEEYGAQMELFTDPLQPGWTVPGIIYEVALKEGYSLTSQVTAAAVAGNAVYKVTDRDHDQHFHICLDDTISPDVVAALGLATDDFFICRDIALDDSLAANLALQCRLKIL